MIHTYSKRLLSPFSGMVQVAEMPGARALSLDGKYWAIQYSLVDAEKFRASPAAAWSAGEYALVATVEAGEVDTRPLHPFLDGDAVRAVIERLAGVVTSARLPFAAADRYQYWLLDGKDGTPLALLHSCIREEEMAGHQPEPVWIAMPDARLKVPDPEAHPDPIQHTPPVNYRLEKSVEERAGPRPRAAWFELSGADGEGFPPCLLREDWENAQQQRLCDLYLRRLAPRLLVLPGLPASVRRRLEVAARAHVFDVERFHPLYPEVIDRELIDAARVEARLRRAAES